MTLQNARSRLVSFRLSEDELEDLRVACLIRGARNVSEFARGAVLGLTGAPADAQVQLLDRFAAVDGKLVEIQSSLQHNGEMLRALLKTQVTRTPERNPRATDSPDRGEDPTEKAKGAP